MQIARLAEFREIIPCSSSLVSETRPRVARRRSDYRNRPFTFYEKAVTAGSRTEVSNADILRGPVDAGFIRVYSAARSIR